ncbi:MAG: hypothetical protein LBV26_03050 [Bacteroidales bacterium]|nr:hypothetical protein [Bacteroidales bacterium]
MKTIVTAFAMTALLITGSGALAQNNGEDYLGLPGDNLNLYAVMKLFQESETLEGFERSLNDESSRINNLDLNGDSQIDYISVYDNEYNNVHNIVLQVALSRMEKQDVAVFTVERDSYGNISLQLTGDEELYGKNYIIEPVNGNMAGTPNPGYTGNAASVNGRNTVTVTTTVVEVSAWPVITYIYRPGYVVWRSSWYWGYYPSYWKPWRPYYWHYYYGYHNNWHDRYYASYHRSAHHRHDYWHRYYYRPHHVYSNTVTRNIRSGHYRTTYSRPDERSRGEALYISTYGNSNRRQESVRATDASRRPVTNANRSNVSSGRRTSGAAAENAARPATSASSTNRRTGASGQSSAGRTGSPERSSVQSSSSGAATRNVARPATGASSTSRRTGASGQSSVSRTDSPQERKAVQPSASAARQPATGTSTRRFSDSGTSTGTRTQSGSNSVSRSSSETRRR